MAKIIIDGTQLDVPDNKNVLDAALENGIYIPHLCHHPDLSELGSCRLCIVSVEGYDEIVPSCTLKAKDGMVITTNNEKIAKLRSLALELLLSGHPEECSTCPKYGNCELQTVLQYIGVNNARLRMRSKGFRLNEENPLINHDMNRCVLCGRCVRACNELRGVKVLQYNKNEVETYVGTLHDKLLKDVDCRFCGACAEVCPTGTIRDKISAATTGKKKEDLLVPCRAACPAGTDIPRYVRLTKEGKYSEATAVIREKLPLPNCLGHICTHACELDCRRGQVNDAISIRNIKRYAVEHDDKQIWKDASKQLPDTGKKVAVVGAGAAGLTAAYYLRKQGHSVTLMEELPKLGGMLQYGLPSYRMPRDIVDEEAEILTSTGIKVETNKKVEKPADLLAEGYDAVLMAIGAHNGVKLPMEGNDYEGVLVNIDFLRKASMGLDTGMGKKVIVLGGGNVAFDCARTARRLGAEEVSVACLEAREAMTADDEEIDQAKEEGINVYPAQTFEKILGDGKVSGVTFSDIESFTFDENRRPVIKKVPDSEHTIEGDTVIFAVGQRPNITQDAGLELGRGNSIVVKEGSLETGVKGIFAAGDVVYGTASVVKAVASGRDAASQIDIYLGGNGDISEVLAPVEEPDAFIGRIEGFDYKERIEADVTPVDDRKSNFNLVDHGICDGSIGCEAERCLQCDLRLQISQPRVWQDYSSAEKEGK